MDRANPKLKFTKTDFCRLLNASSERFPEAIAMRQKYMEKCARARCIRIGQFGFWLQANHSTLFNRLYKQASKLPELIAEAYADESSSAPA